MFTEGLDDSARRWVNIEKEVPLRNSNLRPRMDPINLPTGIGLPPPAKFRSGHLAFPFSRTFPGDVDGSVSGSDNDMSIESDDDVYPGSGRRSLGTSPRDERVLNGAAPRHGNMEHSRLRYASDSMYSDVSSSRETIFGGQGKFSGRLGKGNGRYTMGPNVYTEDDSSDSAASSEFSTTQAGSISGAMNRSRAYASEGYASSVTSQVKVESLAKKGSHVKKLQHEKYSSDDEEDIPSAPPFSGPAQQTKQATARILTPGVPSSPIITDSQSPSTKTDTRAPVSGVKIGDVGNKSETFVRTNAGAEAAVSSGSQPALLPTYHASALGPWHAVVSYDACVRLCLHAWAKGCMDAPSFLENECALLRDAFGLQQVLLQSEEELMAKRSSEVACEGVAPKSKKTVGKIKVQVRRVKTTLDTPTGCSMISLRQPMIKLDTVRYRLSSLQSTFSAGWQSLRKIRVPPRLPAKASFSRNSLAYVHASTQYIKQVSGVLKIGVTSLRNSSTSYDVQAETYSCMLRMKSSTEDDTVRMQPGSGESHVFFPDSLGDDLIVEILDSKGNNFGRVLAQVATISEDPTDKIRWWSIYREPEHELVGRLQLYINYSTSSDDTSHLKCGSVAETVAYDLVLEVAMKVQRFQQRNLLLYGSWKWLLTEFASYYGVSDVYTKLRYLSYIMDVATPTADCLTLVYDLMMPVVMKGNNKSALSHQENRIMGETKDQIEQILAMVFENYKSLDESSLSGVSGVFKPATGLAAPALEPAVKLYTVLHDILSPEAQTSLCHYFQVAAKKRSRRHLAETDEFVTNNNEPNFMDHVAMSTAYQKMTAVCNNIKKEILTDIEIHNQHILPSFIDLPNLSASIYSTELCNRLRAFLLACPPSGPSSHVAELVISTADFQRDHASWNLSPVKGGVDAKELFHLYIMLWIQDKRLALLESCKLDKVKWSGVRTQHSTTPFIDEMYDRLRETLGDYEVIICRWPEYIFVLENAIADVEKEIVKALDRQYGDVLAPLKDLTPKKFGLKYVQKLAKRSVCSYTVPDELGVLLNSMKRMLDILRPKIEAQFKSWGSCIPDGGNTVPGERLSEVTVMLRAKFRSYLQAVVEKLTENTKMQSSTKLKKILQDSKESVGESDIRGRMQPLRDQLKSTISHLHTVCETHVFVAICRGYWDRMGQDVLGFLENRKENRSWYKGSRIAVSILDDTFASEMQQLVGNALHEKELEPPRSILEVRSMLCKDTPNPKDSRYYY